MTTTEHVTNSNTSSSSMDSVMNDRGLFQGILSFVPDTFRFTAAVSRLFRQSYLETHNHENKYRTSHRNALQAIGTARIWAAEIPRLVFWKSAASYLEVCDWAAAYGTLDVLKDLRANEYDWSPNTCSYAAERGDLDMLKWAREHGCPWNEDCCSYAAYGGHLELLKWARQNGCRWDKLTCSRSAEGGHLKVLIWARENGCPTVRRHHSF